MWNFNDFEDAAASANASDAPLPLDIVSAWLESKAALVAAQAEEMKQRRAIIDTFMASQSEGGKTYKIADSKNKLSATIVVNRSIDEGTLYALQSQLLEDGINVEALVRYKPELNIKAYKALTEDQRNVFDQVLTIRDGSPQLSYQEPKAKK